MKIDYSILELISELEYIIGNETLSKSSFAGGGVSVEDYPIRYPVRISLDNNTEESKLQVRNKVHEFYITRRNNSSKEITKIEATPAVIETMYYAFGSHRLYIGDALLKVLEFLENRYGIDFNELEKKCNK